MNLIRQGQDYNLNFFVKNSSGDKVTTFSSIEIELYMSENNLSVKKYSLVNGLLVLNTETNNYDFKVDSDTTSGMPFGIALLRATLIYNDETTKGKGILGNVIS